MQGPGGALPPAPPPLEVTWLPGRRGPANNSGAATSTGRKEGVLANLLTSGLSVGAANAATNPLDVLRVRLSLNTQPRASASAGASASPAGALPYTLTPLGPAPAPGLLACGRSVVAREGAAALWRGLVPSVGCGLFIGGTRLGLYNPLKDALLATGSPATHAAAASTSAMSSSSSSSGGTGVQPAHSASEGSAPCTRIGAAAHSPATPPPPLAVKLGAACLSGGVASAVWSPLELIKTRMQAAPAPAPATGNAPPRPHAALSASSSTAARAAGCIGGAGPGPGAGPAHRTMASVVSSVVRADGVAGLWRGAMPAAVRTAVLTAAQCVTYDEVKRSVMARSGWSDASPATHFSSSLVAGLVTTTLTNPIEVVKTRLFMAGRGAYGGARWAAAACAAEVLAREGVRGFMKGWSAAYARIGPHTVLMFMTAERLRIAAGLTSL